MKILCWVCIVAIACGACGRQKAEKPLPPAPLDIYVPDTSDRGDSDTLFFSSVEENFFSGVAENSSAPLLPSYLGGSTDLLPDKPQGDDAPAHGRTFLPVHGGGESLDAEPTLHPRTRHLLY